MGKSGTLVLISVSQVLCLSLDINDQIENLQCSVQIVLYERDKQTLLPYAQMIDKVKDKVLYPSS